MIAGDDRAPRDYPRWSAYPDGRRPGHGGELRTLSKTTILHPHTCLDQSTTVQDCLLFAACRGALHLVRGDSPPACARTAVLPARTYPALGTSWQDCSC